MEFVEAALVLIGILVLCVVSSTARHIVGRVLLVVGVLLRAVVPAGDDDRDWPPPWRRRRL